MHSAIWDTTTIITVEVVFIQKQGYYLTAAQRVVSSGLQLAPGCHNIKPRQEQHVSQFAQKPVAQTKLLACTCERNHLCDCRPAFLFVLMFACFAH